MQIEYQYMFQKFKICDSNMSDPDLESAPPVNMWALPAEKINLLDPFR